jgi:hypothetical protein
MNLELIINKSMKASKWGFTAPEVADPHTFLCNQNLNGLA